LFYDVYGQVVLRERVPIVSKKAGGVGPGETKAFRLPFDSIPESWGKRGKRGQTRFAGLARNASVPFSLFPSPLSPFSPFFPSPSGE
jgi:hypothetical protein